MDKDLTIIFLTTDQHPPGWTAYHREVLELARGDYPLIESRPLPGEPHSHLTMYRQLLRACEVAETPYIAAAEDDTLYPREHFDFYRPALDTIGYDMSRWSLYWWEPTYSIKQRITNCTLIAPRLEYIEALRERLVAFESYPYISEVGRYESQLKVAPRKIERAYCEVPVIQFNHPGGIGTNMGRRKRLGQLKAYDIPVWGRAEEIIARYV